MQCSRKFLFVYVVCPGRFLQSCWWWRWYLPHRLCTQFVCVVVISWFHFVHGCWECIEHIWPMERRLGANVVRESCMSRKTKKYLVVYFLVFFPVVVKGERMSTKTSQLWKFTRQPNVDGVLAFNPGHGWKLWCSVLLFCFDFAFVH